MNSLSHNAVATNHPYQVDYVEGYDLNRGD